MGPDAPAGGTVTCPDCGREQPADQQLCECGYPLEFDRRRESVQEVPSVTRAPGEQDDDTAVLPPVVDDAPPPAAPVPPAGPRPAASREVACPSCGEGNAPSRTWCARCGTRLRREPVAPPLAPAPPRRSRTGPLMALAVGGLVLALVAVLGVVVWRSTDRDGQSGGGTPTAAPSVSVPPERLPTDRIEDVRATSTQAPEGGVTYVAGNTVDGRTDTAWNHDGSDAGTSTPGIDPEGVRLVYTFTEPVHVTGLFVLNGYQRVTGSGQDLFTVNRRVGDVRITGDNGGVATTFADTRAEQLVPADLGRTSTVTIEIVATYPSARFRDVALSEVGFQVQP